MNYPDFHMHSCFSTDSSESLQHIAERAFALGMSCICITDHHDPDFPGAEFQLDMDTRNSAVLDLREDWAGRLDIRLGVELGLQPHLAGTGRIEELLAAHPFDYIIGSVHMVDGIDPYVREDLPLDDDEMFRRYFEQMLSSVRGIRGFQSVGHLNYIVRCGDPEAGLYSYARYSDLIDEILRVMVSRDLALEVNTAGYRKGLGAPNPDADVVRRFRELGGEKVILGSDAHVAADIGADFERAVALIRDAGFRYLTVFRERLPEYIPL